jgi:hypothetical protein
MIALTVTSATVDAIVGLVPSWSPFVAFRYIDRLSRRALAMPSSAA